MKVERYDGTLTRLDHPIEVTLICITHIDAINKEVFAGGFFEEIEKISFKKSVDIVLLDIKSSEDTAFVTALALDRIQTYARMKCNKHDICVCLHRPSAQEFRSVDFYASCLSISYREICLEKALADIFTTSG